MLQQTVGPVKVHP